MGPPNCSQQRAGDRAPQLGAGDAFGVRRGQSLKLSDKELETVMDDPVEDGLRPWGNSATVFEDRRCQSLVLFLSAQGPPCGSQHPTRLRTPGVQ